MARRSHLLRIARVTSKDVGFGEISDRQGSIRSGPPSATQAVYCGPVGLATPRKMQKLVGCLQESELGWRRPPTHTIV
jgi:hypothetical protein